MTPEDCAERSMSFLGSSTLFPPSFSPSGALSRNKDVNPDLADWNLVFFPYCDGGSFSGNRKEPLDVHGRKVYLRGRRILDFLLSRLISSYGLDIADEVLVSGCSAGGLSVYMNCDYISNFLTASSPSVKVKCMGDAGVFLDRLDVAGKPTAQDLFSSVFDLHELEPSAIPACISERKRSLHYQCMMAQYIFPYIKAPLFVINSLYDSWSLPNLIAPRKADPKDRILRDCIHSFHVCTSKQHRLLQEYREATIAAAKDVLESAENATRGAFLFSCYHHCVTESDILWSRMQSAEGKTLISTLGKWLNEDAKQDTKVVDCELPCNKCELSKFDPN